jgi:hypothetical protein
MQQHADLARLCRGATIPLTLLALGAGTTTADTGGIHHAQASINLSTPLMYGQRLISRTVQRAIGLESEVLSRESTNFEGGGNRGLAIATGVGLLLVGLGQRRSKLGSAYGIRLQLMTQL